MDSNGQGQNAHGRRFHRRAYERARDAALALLPMRTGMANSAERARRATAARRSFGHQGLAN